MKAKKYLRIPIWWPDLPVNWKLWLPSRGNVIFTTLMILLLVWAQTVGAFPALNSTSSSTGTIAYQGRLADSSGNPLTNTLNMSFRLYGATTGGSPLWTEEWTGSNGVQVSDGLFNVMLGSLTPIPQSVIAGNSNLFLGITVGTDDEMSPRVQLGSVPFAVQALTVPDGSVTTAKIADGAVTTAKVVNGAITQAKLGADVSLVPPDGSITTAKIADGAVTPAKSFGLVSTNGGNLLIQHAYRTPVSGTNFLITFPRPYAGIPTVVAVPESNGGQWINVHSISTTGFHIMIPNTGGSIAINWIAIGPVD